MFSLLKKMFLTSLFVVLGLGTLFGGFFLLAGPDRGKAVLHGVQARVSEAIDSHLDDPVSLRNQLRELERTYPERISAVRGDLAELEGQMRQLERERAISLRVVALADQDLATLKPRLEEAQVVASASRRAGRSRVALVSLRFDDNDYSLERASAKIRQIKNTRSAHSSRAADAEHSLAYLDQQIRRFVDVLSQLESEQVQFQAQLFQLNRQVDSIQRNDRLIEMLAERKRTLDECTSYDVVSLDQVTGKLEQILTRQEAELDVLASPDGNVNYVDRAREQLREEHNSEIRVPLSGNGMMLPVTVGTEIELAPVVLR